MTDRVAWANLWHQHLIEQAADNPLAVGVLELHKPDVRGDCSGCESDGYEAEQPEYGCATVELIAASFGLTLAMRCPACGSHQRTLVTGGPVGHHRRDGDMLVSCPGSTEELEAFPWRSDAQVMADFTERLMTGVAEATRRVESALGLPSPVPSPVQLHAVQKWGQEAQARDALFSE